MPRIYIANLEAYNAGRLQGEWLDIDDYHDQGELAEAIGAVAAGRGQDYTGIGDGPFGHDCTGSDWAVHDYEDFPNMGEHPSIAELWAVIEVARDHAGEDCPDILHAVWHVLSEYTEPPQLGSTFEDAFAGTWESEREYAEELVRDCHDLRGLAEQYFDYEKWTRDLFMSDYASLRLPSGQLAIFRNI